jgi:hypothetical protein
VGIGEVVAQPLREELQTHGAQERAEHGPRSADDRHDDHEHGDLDVEQAVGVDRDLLEGVDRSRHRRQGPGHGKGGHLGLRRVHSRGGGGVLVLVDGAQAIAEPAARDGPDHGHGHHGQAEEDEVEAVVARVGGGRLAAHGRHGDPAPAAGQAVEVGDDLARALGHPQGGDREVVALEAQDGDAHEDGEQEAHERRRGQREPEGQAGLGHENRGGVAAEAEEHDVAEARIAGVAPDDVPALGEHDVHEHRGHRPLLAGVELAGQDDQEDEHQGSGHPPPAAPQPSQAGRRRRARAGRRGAAGRCGGPRGHQVSRRAS